MNQFNVCAQNALLRREPGTRGYRETFSFESRLIVWYRPGRSQYKNAHSVRAHRGCCGCRCGHLSCLLCTRQWLPRAMVRYTIPAPLRIVFPVPVKTWPGWLRVKCNYIILLKWPLTETSTSSGSPGLVTAVTRSTQRILNVNNVVIAVISRVDMKFQYRINAILAQVGIQQAIGEPMH